MKDSTSGFYQLDPDVVLNAASSLGYAVTGHCQALNSLENRVFDLKLDDGTAIVMKCYRPNRWSKNQIQEEHDYLFELLAEEIPVVAPLQRDNETIFTTKEIIFSLWPRVGGREPEELSAEQLTSLGSLLARIHLVSERKKFQYRLELNDKNFIKEPLSYIEPLLPEVVKERYLKVAADVALEYHRLVKNQDIHRIHGDCHKGNLLSVENSYLFLDFDDCMMGPPIQDFWMLASTGDEQTRMNLDYLADGYSQFKEFGSNWLSQVELLRAMRFIHYSGWISRRWHDATFKNAFPHFATEKYWQEETADLEAQVEKFSASLPMAEVENHDNSEYFYDWEQ